MLTRDEGSELIPYSTFKDSLRKSMELDENEQPSAIAEAYVKFTRDLREQIPEDNPKRAKAELDEREAQALADYLESRRKPPSKLDDKTLTALSNSLTTISAFLETVDGKMPKTLSILHLDVNMQIMKNEEADY